MRLLVELSVAIRISLRPGVLAGLRKRGREFLLRDGTVAVGGDLSEGSRLRQNHELSEHRDLVLMPG